MSIEAKGKCGISAKVVADSISEQGKRITSFVLEYPRIILAELNTHKILSKSTASSRAIPFEKMLQQLTARPVRFGAANKGMQDKGTEHNGVILYPEGDYYGEYTPEAAWESAKHEAIKWAEALYKAGYHKQTYNRLLEPFAMAKTIVTATETSNFFWLRIDEAADPSIYSLASCMKEAMDNSVPTLLKAGEWHLPLVSKEEVLQYGSDDCLKISAARCAAVSYRAGDYGYEQCMSVWERLFSGSRIHSSPAEHQATPMDIPRWDLSGRNNDSSVNIYNEPDTWQQGISHCDREGQLWSANFAGWIQHRKLIKGENHSE